MINRLGINGNRVAISVEIRGPTLGCHINGRRGVGGRGITNSRWDEVSNEKLHRGMEMSVKFE